jgi:site-specific recombinase XerD
MLQAYCKSTTLLSAAAHIPVSSMHVYIHYLEDNGYPARTIQTYTNAVIHFSQWLYKQSRCCTKATIDDKASFVDTHLPDCYCPSLLVRSKKTCAAALTHWLRLVVQPNAVPPTLSKNDELVMAFDTYLKEVAGLASATRLIRRSDVYGFLAWLDNDQSTTLGSINVTHLTAFICVRASQVALVTTARTACSVNAFLRFLTAQGYYNFNAALRVPRPKLLHTLLDNKSMSNDELHRLLSSIDRSNLGGKRDYAITRCLSDLGIRTGEVASLTIDNIDWRNKTIEINLAKTRRHHKLPIPDTLMEALIDYLINGRPDTDTRQLFVYHRAPSGKPIKPSTVRGVVRRAFLSAGFSSAQSQVHRLRHTMATRLLANNTPIKTIADMLGHQSINTTIRYTYVDQVALALVAMPWPQGGQI